MPRLSAEQRLNHRRRIVDAAWRCVARTGYRELRVEDICAEASVGKGSFYLYFERKDDVLLALLEDDAALMEERITSVLRSERPGVDRLRAFAQTMLAGRGDAARMQVRADLWAVVLSDEAARRRFAERLNARRALLSAAVAEGIATGEFAGGLSAETLAQMVLAIVDGLMLHAAAEPETMRWESIRGGVDALIAGLRSA